MMKSAVEEIARQVTINVSSGVEIMSGIIIGIAIGKVVFNYISYFNKRRPGQTKEQIRVQFGSSVAVALELLLGADVLATAVAPSWNDIGQLAAIATIRTVLNFFLERELKHVKSIK